MSFANDVRDCDGRTIGYRCDTCDRIKSRMWGTVCNECRERREQAHQLAQALLKLAEATLKGNIQIDTTATPAQATLSTPTKVEGRGEAGKAPL